MGRKAHYLSAVAALLDKLEQEPLERSMSNINWCVCADLVVREWARIHTGCLVLKGLCSQIHHHRFGLIERSVVER